MANKKAVIVDFDIISGYGHGLNKCWDGLLSGNTAISKVDRFKTEHLMSNNAAIVPEISASNKDSFSMQMVKLVLERKGKKLPEGTSLILATINGEIDLLEEYVIGNISDKDESRLDRFFEKIKKVSNITGTGKIVSAACASGSAAVASAAEMIRLGESDSVLVVACDSVSEFLFAGFSSLMALDKDIARPFDANRSGLTIGEAAGFVLVMSEDKAIEHNKEIFGEILGWGITSDSNHMTGPIKNGSGLARAIFRSVDVAEMTTSEIETISAHGTGTVYNDAMEIQAFKKVFTDKKTVPVYSIKGGTGHTMGAAGLIEIIVAIKGLNENMIPGTIGLIEADNDAREWVSSDIVEIKHNITLSVNAGFGGVNSAIILGKYMDDIS